MHKNRILLGWLFSFAAIWAPAQQPYFQQDVAYDIKVRLDDQAHRLTGTEKLTYKNNSPDVLDKMYMHLWPNAYKNNSSAFAKQRVENGSVKFQEAPDSTRGEITGLDFKIDGKSVEWANWEDNPDIAVLTLPKPLQPGESLVLETPFEVKIPKSYSRLGRVGQQYQLCQWYPKPAVYDRDGWHPIPYLDQGEFYSEFGTYDVYIEVPKNYVVGATGDLPKRDPERRWLRKREELSRKLLEKPVTEAIFEEEFPNDAYKTLHFHQENVHDFAWFCDKNYYVLTDTVTLPQSKRTVDCVAMFTNLDRKYWKRGPEYIAQSVYYYSLWNGDYPYNHATAVDGALSAGAGMEYPNITVLGAGGSAESLELVIMHEVGHNWYYGILGSDERSHPWMDEGINTYFEGRYWEKIHGDTMNTIPQAAQKALGINFTHTFMAQEAYRLVANQGLDQPIEGAAHDYTNLNYGIVVYMKTGLAFRYLEAYLGREVIDRCFHAYYEEWKFKHPAPEDVQRVFERESGKDLGWFFGEFVNGTHKLDFRVKKIKGNEITLKNKSGLTLPAGVSLLDETGDAIKTVWTEPFADEITVTLDGEDYHSARVNAEGHIPELRVENNSLKRKGLFKRAKPLEVNFGYKFPDPNKTTLHFMPSLGYNTTDGFMGGLLVYHNFFPKRRFEFHLMPMFGFSSNHLVGSAGFTLHWQPSKIFRKIELHVRGSAFSTIVRAKPFLDFYFRKKEARSPFEHKLTLAAHVLGNRAAENGGITPDDWYLPVFGEARWNMTAANPYYNLRVMGELGGNTSEGVYRVALTGNYERKLGRKMRLGFRGFAGAILSSDPAPFLLHYRISGSGDPFGENILMDRAGTSSWLSQQVVRDHGGFSSMTGGTFDRAVLSATTDLRLPVKLLSVFGGVAAGIGTDGIPNQSFYEAGLRLNMFGQALHINFPVLGTVYDGLFPDFDTFGNGITFSLDPLAALRGVGGGILGL